MLTQALLMLCAVVVITATLLPLWRHDAWWVRVFEFPRVQIAALAAITVAVYATVVGWRHGIDLLLLGLLALCLVFQLWRIVRYTPLHAKQVHNTKAAGDENTLALMLANVLTPNRHAEALLRLVRERLPDVLLTVETDDWWQQRLDTLQDQYPHAVKHPLDNLYGMHLYSRLPLVDPAVHCLVETDVPSIHTRVRLRSGRLVELHCVHPRPPGPTHSPRSTERDAELLLIARSLDKPARRVVVLGDLNDVA